MNPNSPLTIYTMVVQKLAFLPLLLATPSFALEPIALPGSKTKCEATLKLTFAEMQKLISSNLDFYKSIPVSSGQVRSVEKKIEKGAANNGIFLVNMVSEKKLLLKTRSLLGLFRHGLLIQIAAASKGLAPQVFGVMPHRELAQLDHTKLNRPNQSQDEEVGLLMEDLGVGWAPKTDDAPDWVANLDVKKVRQGLAQIRKFIAQLHVYSEDGDGGDWQVFIKPDGTVYLIDMDELHLVAEQRAKRFALLQFDSYRDQIIQLIEQTQKPDRRPILAPKDRPWLNADKLPDIGKTQTSVRARDESGKFLKWYFEVYSADGRRSFQYEAVFFGQDLVYWGGAITAGDDYFETLLSYQRGIRQ